VRSATDSFCDQPEPGAVLAARHIRATRVNFALPTSVGACQCRRLWSHLRREGRRAGAYDLIRKCPCTRTWRSQQRCARPWSAKHAHVSQSSAHLFGTPSNLQGMGERDRQTGAVSGLNMQPFSDLDLLHRLQGSSVAALKRRTMHSLIVARFACRGTSRRPVISAKQLCGSPRREPVSVDRHIWRRRAAAWAARARSVSGAIRATVHPRETGVSDVTLTGAKSVHTIRCSARRSCRRHMPRQLLGLTQRRQSPSAGRSFVRSASQKRQRGRRLSRNNFSLSWSISYLAVRDLPSRPKRGSYGSFVAEIASSLQLAYLSVTVSTRGLPRISVP